MNKESILYGVIGLLAGVVIAGFVAGQAVNNNQGSVMRMMGIDSTKLTSDDNSMGMDSMVNSLRGKSGDDFDKTFLAEMIIHHQGAIDMANLAKQKAKHDEIKNLADGIITAQTKEIDQMKSWQQQWNYSTDDNSMGGMHTMH